MTKIIGLNIPQSRRPEYWDAMKVFRAGSIELKTNPDTKHIAIADEGRYNRLLNLYAKDAQSASLKEPILEASLPRH